MKCNHGKYLMRSGKTGDNLWYRNAKQYLLKVIYFAWKVSKYWVFSGPNFPVFRVNTEIYSVNLRIQSKNRKIRTRKTPYLNTFHAVLLKFKSYNFWWTSLWDITTKKVDPRHILERRGIRAVWIKKGHFCKFRAT